jgi:hypothetical protein
LIFVVALLAAAPAPACAGERVAVAPFEPLATTPADARAAEDAFRFALNAMGYCVEARKDTIAKLSRYDHARLPPCADDLCAVSQAVDLGTQWLMTGVVLGVGGKSSARVSLVPNALGAVRRATVTDLSVASVTKVVSQLFHGTDAVSSKGPTGPVANGPTRWPTFAVGGAGLAALIAGTVMATQSKALERQLGSDSVGCAGVGQAYADCFDAKIRDGRQQATSANIFFGGGAALLVGAGVMWVVEIP